MGIEKIKARLMNKAVHYLGRYSASEQRLLLVLGRFAKRKLADTDKAEIAIAIKSVVDKCLRLGYVDNDAYAETLARSQRRQGKSAKLIWQKLRQHALDDTAIEKALHIADANHHNAELAAAIHFARRRRLGPFSQFGAEELGRHKQLGSLARAGFSIAICRTVLNAKSIHDLEELEYDAMYTEEAGE